jgi:LacI family transcriptional regulator
MKQIRTVRMAEIAQKLGVTQSTVSRALRNDPRIGEEMSARVREMAKSLGYRPNPLISALMANRRRGNAASEIGVIALVTNYGGRVSWRSKDVCCWEFQGVQQRAEELGYRVEVFALGDYGGDQERLAATLRSRGIRGVLLGFSRDDREDPPFPLSGFAVAGLSAYFPRSFVDRANFHGFYNVQLALEHIRSHGYRRAALVAPDRNNRISHNLWSGAFLDWQRCLPEDDRLAPFIPVESDGAEEFHQWFDKNRPDALLVYKAPVRRYLAKRGLATPKDIGLAYLYRTSDEMGSAAGIDGQLKTVGELSLELVAERLTANRMEASKYPKEVLVKGTWHEGPTLALRLAGAAR